MADQPVGGLVHWVQHPLVLALAGGLLEWMALPPLRWWPLGWIAPLFWLVLVTRRDLPGRRPYGAIWAASAIQWAIVMQGIRLAHWANYLGLVALSCYLGIYLPIFVAIARRAVHTWRLPLILAAPIAWTGIELVRGYGPLGFSMALLAHTQVTCLRVVQISDLCGAYTVSFLMMLVAAGLVSARRWQRGKWAVWPALPLAAALVATLVYGHFRLGQKPRVTGGEGEIRVALIQGSIDTLFEDNPDRPLEILNQYNDLTQQALDRYGRLDLIVWPESMFPVDEMLVDDVKDLQIAPFADRNQIDEIKRGFSLLINNGIRRWNEPADKSNSGEPSTRWLLGTTTWQFGNYASRRYNAALIVDPHGRIAGRYYKMHPVIFGEYVPFGEIAPWLYHLFPLPNGLTPGTSPLGVEAGGLTMSVSICFENTMPQLLRRQAVQLERQGRAPDLLVNLTNDGWFWGSSILDMQLDCAVFRAIELRRPFLIAANTGLSAWIDGSGRIRARGPRRATAVLLAKPCADGRRSLYERWGDLPASLCALFCLLVAVSRIWK